MNKNFETAKESLTKALEALRHEIAQFQKEQERLMTRTELTDDERAELTTWLSGEIGILASSLGYQSEQGFPGALIVNWTPDMTRFQGNLNSSLRDLIQKAVGEHWADTGDIGTWNANQKTSRSVGGGQPFDAGDIADWKKNQRAAGSVGGEQPLDAGSIGDWEIRGLILGPNLGNKIRGMGGGE